MNLFLWFIKRISTILRAIVNGNILIVSSQKVMFAYHLKICEQEYKFILTIKIV